MPDLIAIGQSLTALKTLSDIAQTAFGLRDSAKLLEAQVEFNRQILAVQSTLAEAQKEQTTLTQTIRNLEEQITKFETWETDKQQYQMQALRSGAIVYALKPEAQSGKPLHYICARCYENRKRSPLQPAPRSAASIYLSIPNKYMCPECKTDFVE
jgi:cell division protein FtsB